MDFEIIDSWEPEYDDGTNRYCGFIRKDGKYYHAILEDNAELRETIIYMIIDTVSEDVAYGRAEY